jgi:hypothetical protein
VQRTAFILLVMALAGCGSEPPTPLPRGALDERKGIAYEHGVTEPFTGALTRYHVHNKAQKSNEVFYHEGLKVVQRTWFANGQLMSEYRFHRGHVVVQRTWDINGRLLTWNKQAQLNRANTLLTPTNTNKDFVEGFVWVHIADANGHENAPLFLNNPPPGITQQQLDEATAIAEGLLAEDFRPAH